MGMNAPTAIYAEKEVALEQRSQAAENPYAGTLSAKTRKTVMPVHQIAEYAPVATEPVPSTKVVKPARKIVAHALSVEMGSVSVGRIVRVAPLTAAHAQACAETAPVMCSKAVSIAKKIAVFVRPCVPV